MKIVEHNLAYFQRRSIPITESGCWIWDGILNDDGYALVGTTRNGKHRGQRGHRLAYEAAKGPIPHGLTIDHLCCVKSCVNPDHLAVATRAENISRAKRKTHCRRGHLLNDENTYHFESGGRTCKECAIMRGRIQYHG